MLTKKYYFSAIYTDILYSRKVWRGKVWQINSFQAFGERKLGKLKDQPIYRLLIVSIYLDGFSLVNHGQLAKFTKLSPCQTFPLPKFPAICYLVFAGTVNYICIVV